jgi:hypothetical protein
MENAEGKEEVSVVVDTDPSEEAEFHDAIPNPTVNISMHALCGTTTGSSTFTLKLKMGNS